MPRPSLTRLRHQLAGTRPGLLLALCVALLFAQLGQASHLHAPQDLGHHFDDDHCSFCAQLDRPAPVPVAPPALAPPRQALPRAATRPAREPSRPPLLRYDARGPPTR